MNGEVCHHTPYNWKFFTRMITTLNEEGRRWPGYEFVCECGQVIQAIADKNGFLADSKRKGG